MQDRKLPVTQLGHQSSKFKKARRPHNKGKKTKSFKILSLLASIGATVSLTQPAKATTIVNDKGKTIIAQLPSLDTSQKISQSVALKNLSTIDSQSSTVSIKTQLERSPTTETIPQLPALEVAQTKQPEAERIHTVKAGETIAKIARQYGVSIEQIIEANQLTNPNFVSIDRQLVIPNSELARGVSNNTKSEAISAQGGASLISDSAKPLTSFAEKKAELRNQKKTAIDNSSRDRQLTNDDSVTQDSYISKLRESIIELRTRYQNQNGSSDPTVANTTTVDNTVTDTTLNTTPQINSLSEVENQANNRALGGSSTTSTPAETNSLISLSGTNTVTPALPPLASPEEYLPDNPLFEGYMWPAKGTLTSGYGWRWGRMHKGIDIAAPIGTPIMAAAPGEVIFAGWNGGYGNLVKLQHSDGSVTFYAHNNRVLVHNGQKVSQGQLIAEMGSTGRSTGPHLHFEIRPNGTTAINPIAHLPKSN
jgi:murein DD-endopeptidase MepM/ murein hydrolase activator NlpD